MTKTIALICQHFYPEMMSTGLLLTELTTSLVAEGTSMRVYASKPSYLEEGISAEIPKRMHHEGVEIIRVPGIGNPKGNLPTRTLFSVTYLLGTMWCIIRDRHEIAGVLSTTNPPFIGLAALCGKLLFGIPYITIVHDIYPDVAIKLGVLRQNGAIATVWKHITNLVLNHGEQNTVLGRDMDELVKQKLKPGRKDRTVLIPNWSDERRMFGGVTRSDNPFIHKHDLEDKFVVQYSGRMGRTHNIEPLIHAAATLKEEPIVFQFIGDGPKRLQLKKLADDYGLKNVQFLPYQPIEELHFSLSAPDVAIVCLDTAFTGLSVPSKSYGIMANGTAIVAFLDAHSEIGQTLIEYDCGIVLSDPTAESVAALLKQLISAPDRVARLGANGFEAFKQQFTRAKAVEKYSILLEEVFQIESQDQSAQLISV